MRSIRKEMEQDICAHNKVLRTAVKSMDWIQLLNNCHPLYREGYARRLHNSGLIHRTEAAKYCRGRL